LTRRGSEIYGTCHHHELSNENGFQGSGGAVGGVNAGGMPPGPPLFGEPRGCPPSVGFGKTEEAVPQPRSGISIMLEEAGMIKL